jgi:hypothetical protein
MRNMITFMLEEIKSRMRDIVISLKKIEFRNVEMLLYLFEESTVNENRFSNACNRIHNCQNDDSRTIKKRKTLFRKRKFDVLIEFIQLRILSTKNCSAFIKEIFFSYFLM